MLRMLQMPKGGCFAFSRLASHIRVLSKSGESPRLCFQFARKTTIMILFRVFVSRSDLVLRLHSPNALPYCAAEVVKR